jgi:hypothetical protein
MNQHVSDSEGWARVSRREANSCRDTDSRKAKKHEREKVETERGR